MFDCIAVSFDSLTLHLHLHCFLSGRLAIVNPLLQLIQFLLLRVESKWGLALQ